MLRERSAGARMISRLEHKSLLVRGSVPTCLDHSHVQHKSWTMFYSYFLSQFPSILALLCLTYIILHASSMRLYASACIGTMHVHARIEGLHVYACIPSLACFCTCLLVSRAEQISAFVGSYWEMSVYLNSESWACVFMFLESWAFVRMFSELSVYLHSVFCVESWTCVCMRLHVSRAGIVCAFCGLDPGLSVFLFCGSWACVCIQWLYQELSVYLSVSARIDGWACAGTERVWSCVCTY